MTTHPLLQQIASTCQRLNLLPPQSRLVLGVSGGVDSLVMLHAFCQLRETLQIELWVATLDHGLRGQEGADDALYVETLAQKWGVDCIREKVDVPRLVELYGSNIEATARQARYTFLMQTAIRADTRTIALAHHHDDQAETILMHLIRGAGLRGLQGMSYSSVLSENHLLEDWPELVDGDDEPSDFRLIRPLLDIPRAVIEDYAHSAEIEARQDASNQDITRLRNTIRHELMPTLAKLNPTIMRTLNRMALVVQGELEVVDRQIETIAAWMLEWSETEATEAYPQGGEVVFLDRSQFNQQSVGIQRGLLRKIIGDLALGLHDVSFEWIERARHLILSGQTGAQCEFTDDIMLRIGYDEVTVGYGGNPVYPVHLPSLSPQQSLRIDPEGQNLTVDKLKLVAYWVLEGRSKDLYPASPLECTLAIPEGATLGLRTWQTGDRFKPFGMGGKSQKLSDTFTNLKVPAFYRHKVPLLTVNDEIAWIVAPTASGPQSRIADTFAVRDEHSAVLRLRWQAR